MAGLANTHLGSMNNRDHWDRSSGEVTTAERQSLRVRAQRSLAPFGTCWRVGTLEWRMIESEGRGVESGGDRDEDGRDGGGGDEQGDKGQGGGEVSEGPPLLEMEVAGRVFDAGGLGDWLRARVFLQFPMSPGRQHKQGLPCLTQEHRRHFAVPLQRQQRVKTRWVAITGQPPRTPDGASTSTARPRHVNLA